MSSLVPFNENVQTMSSREIAELTGKEHKNVLRVIRDLINDQILDAQIEPLKFEYRGQWFDYYELNKRDSLVVVGRLCPEYMAAVFDRWQELESIVAKPIDPMKVFNDPAAMRGLLLTYSEKVIDLEHKLEEMQPDVIALERLSKSDGSICLTDAAKTLQMQPRKFNTWLQAHGWIHKRVGASHWIGYQEKIQSGHLEHKVTPISLADGTDKIAQQVRVTPKGLARLSKLIGQGVPA